MDEVISRRGKKINKLNTKKNTIIKFTIYNVQLCDYLRKYFFIWSFTINAETIIKECDLKSEYILFDFFFLPILAENV